MVSETTSMDKADINMSLAERAKILKAKMASAKSASLSAPPDTPSPIVKEKKAKDSERSKSSDSKSKQTDQSDKRKRNSKTIKRDPADLEANAAAAREREAKEAEEDEDEEFRWWEQQQQLASNDDDSVKWTSLKHNGVIFPPAYQPHGVPLLYGGKEIALEPSAEEIATFYATVLGTDHQDNPIFRDNFWADFRAHLEEIGSQWKDLITDFAQCDFGPIHEHLMRAREAKKALGKEEKEKLKQEKKQLEELYGYCLIDGRREKIGNYSVEPPGLFRGRGKHPKAGKLKQRVTPEQITINIGPSDPIPLPPPGHQWGRIVHDNRVTWLASWTDNVNGGIKYVFLAPNSSLRGQSDLRKFETARRLKGVVEGIRKDVQRELKDKEMVIRQRATALWLIDRLALRAGNEKGEDEADTVGCCSLRLEHVKLVEPTTVVFDFLGKDSIRYYNEVAVDKQVWINLKIFMRAPKTPSDPIFDRLSTSQLNSHLSSLMPGLTAKVFRTYNASFTFQQELVKCTEAVGPSPTDAELTLAYNRANRQVAILCNHQRAVPKTHAQSMEKLTERILSLRYERLLVRRQIGEQISREEILEELPEALEAEEDMDEETERRKAQEMEQLQLARRLKAEERLREKKAATTATTATEENRESTDAFAATSPSHKRKTTEDAMTLASTESPKRMKSSAQLKASLFKKFTSLSDRIATALSRRTDRDENKTTSLTTSKVNYIDPRITIAWCKKTGMPKEKMFTKVLLEKFKWASVVDKDWEF